MGFSRGGHTIEAMRTSMPDRFRNVAAAVYLDSPITLPEPGSEVNRAMKVLGFIADHFSSGAKEMKRDPTIYRGWLDTRESGLRAARRARPEFRALSFQAAVEDVVTHEMSALPRIKGVTKNVVSRGPGGHMIGLGLDPVSNAHLAEEIAALEVNVARRGGTAAIA